MNEIIKQASSATIVPLPRIAVTTRVATMADLPFLDALQKKHSRALGYFPTKQFEGYIEMGAVLVAWASRPCADGSMGETPMPLGYVISRDRYLKRDELGVIYQLCVAPGHQRGLIGAMLVKEVFARSAYGCRLYCCWCAQDLEANYFWESLGFVPIAFRAGSTGKRRVHIFWQRRMNADDVTTPYWYPCQTNSGAIREDRLVFPIPPGVHWRDIRPLEVQAVAVPTTDKPGLESVRETRRARAPKVAEPRRPATIEQGGLRFADPAPVVSKPEPKRRDGKPAAKACPQRNRRIDPQLVAKARELRDRWMEQANGRLLLAPRGKYDVARALGAPSAAMPLLAAG